MKKKTLSERVVPYERTGTVNANSMTENDNCMFSSEELQQELEKSMDDYHLGKVYSVEQLRLRHRV